MGKAVRHLTHWTDPFRHGCCWKSPAVFGIYGLQCVDPYPFHTCSHPTIDHITIYIYTQNCSNTSHGHTGWQRKNCLNILTSCRPPCASEACWKCFFSVHDVCPLRTKALSYEPVGAQRVAAQTCYHLQVSNMNNLFPTRSMIFPWPAEPQQRRLQVQRCAYSFEKARRWHVPTCVENPRSLLGPKSAIWVAHLPRQSVKYVSTQFWIIVPSLAGSSAPSRLGGKFEA